MADKNVRYISLIGEKPIKLIKWKIKSKSKISKGTLLFLYENLNDNSNKNNAVLAKYKSNEVGTVKKLLKNDGETINTGDHFLELEECAHPIVMKEMCAECGADLKQVSCGTSNFSASVAMVHSIPELVVSQEQAHVLGKADEDHLLKNRKLVLLVDLDQTLIHTTNDHIPPNIKDVYHFQLYGSRSPWYHTRLRPGTREFLENISKYYELHICTFGARPYAHMIAHILDRDGKFFSHRILSRDECFNPTSKTANLKALFPCGDSMVCIIDDREDVWNYSPNLVHVKPYHFFQHTGDINAPPGLTKTEHDSEKPKFVINSSSNNTDQHSVAEDDINEDANEISLQDDRTVSSKEDDLSGKQNENASEENQCDEIHDINNVSSLEKEKQGSDVTDSGIVSEKQNEEGKFQINENENQSLNKNTIQYQNRESELSKDVLPVDDDYLLIKDDTMKNNDDVDNNDTEEDKLTEESTIGDTNSLNGDVIIQDDDDHLLHLDDKLCRIHKAYYEMYDKMKLQGKREIPDVKYIVPAESKKVLKGTYIVFSGVFPTNMPPEKSKAWIIAKSLGAVIQSKIISCKGRADKNATTHLIAARLGTAKVNEAKKLKTIHIVNPHWLWCCDERWEKVDESLFPLTKDTSAEYSLSIVKHNINFESESGCFFTGKEITDKLHKQIEVYPQYDPVTGKRINKSTVKQSFLHKTGRDVNGESSKSGENNETFVNPLLSFSSTDIAKMDQEVEDAFNESDSESENAGNLECKRKKCYSSDESDSSDESLSGDHPHGWRIPEKKIKLLQDTDDMESDSELEFTRFPRAELPVDSEKSEQNSSDSDFRDSVGSVDEEMAAAVEREFLGY